MRQTSIEAYRHINNGGLLAECQRIVLEAIVTHGPMTGGELNRRLGGQYHKRLSELERKGLIYEYDCRACSISGRRAIVWDVR